MRLLQVLKFLIQVQSKVVPGSEVREQTRDRERQGLACALRRRRDRQSSLITYNGFSFQENT